jgi:uncharacterized protein
MASKGITICKARWRREERVEFEWDRKKAEVNLRKHRVSFEEASSIFGDPLAVTFHDPDHSLGEHRFLTFGVSLAGRLLVVAHVDRGNHTRLISARHATRAERMIYVEG